MTFTIAFDVPESEAPMFPGRTYVASTMTQATSLRDAQLFVSEEAAEAFLASTAVPWTLRSFGVVVEVDEP